VRSVSHLVVGLMTADRSRTDPERDDA